MKIIDSFVQKQLSSVWPYWKIIKLLGKGSYGLVYEIAREDIGNQYTSALKVLYIETVDSRDSDESGIGYSLSFRADDEKGLNDFVCEVSEEIDLMMRLKGFPNIVQIEDYKVVCGTKSRTILIRMEELESLDKYIERSKPLQQEDIIRIGLDMCSALECCESKNIIHRDIKPGNIYHSETSGFKLGDFGISRTLDSLRERTSMTGGIGTPQFMAPEVYFPSKYDHTVDIYSLGLVLYALLNDGLPPFCTVSDLDENGQFSLSDYHAVNLRRLMRDLIPPPAKADKVLADIICKACHPVPERRYQMANDFKNALSQYEDSIKGDNDDDPEEDPPERGPFRFRFRFPKIDLISGSIIFIITLVFFLIRLLTIAPLGGAKKDYVKYTVFCEDTSGNILDENTYSGVSGEKIRVPAPLFEGYTPRSNFIYFTLSEKEDDNTLSIIYEPVNNDKIVAYTIISEDNEGKTIAKSARNGIVGQKVVEVASERLGYTIEENKMSMVLSENESANIIYFIYSKVDEDNLSIHSSSQDEFPDKEFDPEPAEVNAPAPDSSIGLQNDEIPSTALHYGSHAYYAVNTDTVLSFWEAKSYCERLGGYLAVINNDSENEALYDYVFYNMGYKSAYFGYTNDGAEGDWYWTNGSQSGYSNWLDGQPDNLNGDEHYALFYYKDMEYKWNDGDFGLDDTGTVTFLVEWDEK